jgi:hypothetical protein
MENIIQFILAYDNSNVEEYFTELCTKLYSEPKCTINDVLFAIINIVIKKHDSVDIITYDYIIPLVEYIIKQVRLNGVITTRHGKKLIDMYMEIIPTLYPNSEFSKHVERYTKSVSITNNMMSLFTNHMPSQPKQSVPITIEELLQRIERLENEVSELKSKL